jgi:outer membrane protein OmpU
MGSDMRYFYSVTTALISAASVLATPTFAAEPITLGVGGKLRQYFFIADQDNAPGQKLNTTGMFSDTEVYFDGKTILDNGIEVRAVIELEAESRNDRNTDEVYVDFITGFGKFRVGEKEGINAAMLDDPAPQAFLTTEEEIIGDVLRPRTAITTRDAFTFKRYANDVLGVSYETPAILPGVKFGVSFHPNLTDQEGAFSKTTTAHNAVDVSGRYEGRFRGGKYSVSGGYFHSETRLGGADGNEAWNANVAVSYGGWDFGGTYLISNPADSRDERAWTAGAMYGIGPYKISAHHMSALREPIPNALRKEKLDRTTLQGAYRVGPGINIGVAGFYGKQRDAGGKEWDGVGMLSGAKLAF